MADDFLDLLYDTPALQAKPVSPAKLKHGLPLPQTDTPELLLAPAVKLLTAVHSTNKFAPPLRVHSKTKFAPPWREDPHGLAVVPAQDAPTTFKVPQKSSRIVTVPAAASAIFSRTSKHSNAYDSEKYAEVPEITHHILPARASAAICVDGVRVDEAVLPEFRSIFRFKHFNKMQSACLQAVSSGILY